jgi:molybdopterin-guanine dinucleotide biosynthesis protein A
MVPGPGHSLVEPMVTREQHPIAAAILAGGLARRLGGINKATLQVGDRRIIDCQLALLRQVADPVFIVSGQPDAFGDLAESPSVVGDALPRAGPLGGIYTALVASPRARTLVVACDMPFLSPALLEILSRPSLADVVIPRSDAGYEPLCATWSDRCAAVIRRRIERGQLKAALVVEELRVEEIGPAAVAACDPLGLLFVNVNTPHDYERAQELSRLKSAR